MRVFNGTSACLDLPFTGNERISINAHSPSGDMLAATEFITNLISNYSPEEVAVIVSGPYELNICANIKNAHHYVVETIDEAISRFNMGDTKKSEEEEATEETETVVHKEEKVQEEETEVATESEEQPVEHSESTEESAEPAETPKKKRGKK